MDTYHRNKYEEYAAFGLPLESKLKPVLEKDIGAPLVKTGNMYDTADFLSGDAYVELKCRRPHHEKDDYNLWILPMCKTLCKDKPVVIYYYWDNDKSLYRIDYDEDTWFANKYNKGIPMGSNQNHWWVPKECWSRVQAN
jgi:hypothetical protein